MYLARGLLCMANRCLLVILTLAFPKNRIKKEAAWVQGRQTSHNARKVLWSFKNISFVHFKWQGQVGTLAA